MRRTAALLVCLSCAGLARAQDVEAPETAPAADTAPALPAEAAPEPPASSDTPAAPAEMTAEELEALGFGSGERATALDTDVRVFGFVDFGTSAVIPKSSDWGGALGRHRSFSIGNFNLYLSKNLSESVRTMGEVRFLYLPNGGTDATGGVISTNVGDYNDFNRSLRWGGVEIERIYIEWSALKYLTIRGGQFLTPYGIWNVDHGSPTYIPVQRPFIIGAGWFPERQTGIELFGRWDASLNDSLGYHLTVSNGQGLTSEYRDLDDNKALGGRLYYENRAFGDLRIGVSGLYGKSTNALTSQTLSAGKIVFGETIKSQFEVLALAADIQWKYKGLQLQAEWISQQVDYTRAGRTQVTSTTTGAPTYPRDGLSWGAYLLGGYRLPWYGIMPFTVVQYLDQTDNLTTSVTKLVSLEFGLNIRPIDALVLKVSYTYAKFPDGIVFTQDALNYIQAQVAWAF